MAYISTFERLVQQEGFKMGLLQWTERGRQLELSAILLIQLKQKFQKVNVQYQKKISQANTKTLRKWVLKVLHAEKIEEVFN